MNVAVLCPGPSLMRTITEAMRWSQSIIAINHALNVQCSRRPHWFVAGDYNTFDEVSTTPLVGTCCPSTLRQYIRYETEVVQWSDLPAIATGKVICNYSVIAGLALAEWLGADAVRLYGADMQGDQSFDGTTWAGRSEERWHRERIELDAMAARLSKHGISFSRILPP